jgi:hypothetical protein
MDVYKNDSNRIGIKVALTSFVILFSTFLFAQNVEVRHLRITSKGKAIFHYMIKPGQNQLEGYNIQIFSSEDDYKRPLKIELRNIQPGKIQTVTFSAANHLSGFTDTLNIKLLATSKGGKVQLISNESQLMATPNMGIVLKAISILMLVAVGFLMATEGTKLFLNVYRSLNLSS